MLKQMPAGTNRLATKMYDWQDVPKSERPVCAVCGATLPLYILAANGGLHHTCERKLTASREKPEGKKQKTGGGRSQTNPWGNSARTLRRRERLRELWRESWANSGLIARHSDLTAGRVHKIISGGCAPNDHEYAAIYRACETLMETAHERERVSGDGLLELRREAGITQSMLAESVGVGANRLRGWEKGNHKVARHYYDACVRVCKEEIERMRGSKA